MSSTTKQVEAVQRLVRESVHAVDALAPDAMRAVLPALGQVRAELQRDLMAALGKVDGGDMFTVLQKAQMLRAMEGAFERIGELDPAMGQALASGSKASGPLAVKNLNTEIARLSAIFEGGVPQIPNIDTAAVLAQGHKLLWRRHQNSARRYAGQIGDDIKHLLAVGVAKHETIEQMVARLRALGGGPKRVTGLDPGADASAVAGQLFQRHRYWADRLVRTEVMHAYNVQHDVATEHANENRPDGEPEYVRKWDAAADNVTCPICKGLDGKTAPIGGKFPGGYDSPPIHPHDRCVTLAWNPRWGDASGATQAKADQRDAMPVAAEPIHVDDGPGTVHRKVAAPALLPAEPAPVRDDEWAKVAMKADVTREQYKAVDAYTGTDFTQVNKYLRGQEFLGKKLRSNKKLLSGLDIKSVITGLDSAIDSSSMPQATTVFRGVRGVTFKAGDLISDKGFQSTTLNRKIAENFSAPGIIVGGEAPAHTIMHIHVPAGTKAIYATGVAGGAESEVILPRNARYRVVSVEGHVAHVEIVGFGEEKVKKVRVAKPKAEPRPKVEPKAKPEKIVKPKKEPKAKPVKAPKPKKEPVVKVAKVKPVKVTKPKKEPTAKPVKAVKVAKPKVARVAKPKAEPKPKAVKAAKPKAEPKPKVARATKSKPMFVDALMAAGDAKTDLEYHALLSTAVRAELDRAGFHKREAADDRITAGPTSTPSARAERNWDGRVVLSNNVSEDGKHFVRILKRDPKAAAQEIKDLSPREVSQSSIAGIRTVFHELIHGYGPIDGHKYNGQSAVVEEIATEVLARRHIRDIFGADMRVDTPIGSYGDYIHKATQAVKNATGKGYGESYEALEKAAHSFKTMKPEQFGDPSFDFKRHLAKAAGVDPGVMMTSWNVAFAP